MKKKILSILVMMLMIVSAVLPVSGTLNFSDTFREKKTTINEIFIDIGRTEDKVLSVDRVMGDRYVKYWEHVIDDVIVKGDSILLHSDIETGEILKYEREWTNIEFSVQDVQEDAFEPTDYLWKQLVCFPDEDDCTYFYTFNNQQEYPLICWEVRHTDGSTILYNIDGESIGYGISSPSEQGFSISNDCSDGHGDCWKMYRQNADEWFQRWCESTICIGLPALEDISSNIQNQNVTFFFELGHSHHLPTRFLVTDEIYYNASQLQNDMAKRQPMKFAFIGSCEGLRETGPGTLSYEFRKGEMNNTVTVGYFGMASCPGWRVSLEWQDYMFQEMDNGLTIKESFDLASAEYPTIADCVRFVGDENLIVGNNPPCPPEKPIGNSVNPPNEMLYFNTTTFDPEGDSIYYLFDWNDGTDSGWLGPYNYGEYVVASHVWNNNGKYYVKVKAKDENNIESEYSDSLDVTITNPPTKPETPTGPSSGKPGIEYAFTTSTIDPDGDAVYCMWNWGDGNFSDWIDTNEASYSWEREAKFNISVRAKDTYGAESDWSDPLSFSTPKNKVTKTPFLRFLGNHPYLFPLLQRLLQIQ